MLAVASFDDGDLHIDFDQQLVTVDGSPIDLAPTHYAVLEKLVRHHDQVLSPERVAELAREVEVPDGFAPKPDRISVYVIRLRFKLGWDYLGNDGSPLESVQGEGYRWRTFS